MYRLKYLIIIFFTVLSCKKDNPSIDVSEWDYVVDSTFYCEFNVDGEKHIINNHKQSGWGRGRFQDSCTIFNFGFNYEDTSSNSKFYIDITKSFVDGELQFSGQECENDSSLCVNVFGPLTDKEFISIFEPGDYHYAKYDTNWLSCRDCQITDGISLIYDINGYSWKTSRDVIYIPSDRINDFYSESYFEITDVIIIRERNLIVEGYFDVKIFGYNDNTFTHFSNGYFKGYIKHPFSANLIQLK